jgi:hypothetical protein
MTAIPLKKAGATVLLTQNYCSSKLPQLTHDGKEQHIFMSCKTNSIKGRNLEKNIYMDMREMLTKSGFNL